MLSLLVLLMVLPTLLGIGTAMVLKSLLKKEKPPFNAVLIKNKQPHCQTNSNAQDGAA